MQKNQELKTQLVMKEKELQTITEKYSFSDEMQKDKIIVYIKTLLFHVGLTK